MRPSPPPRQLPLPHRPAVWCFTTYFAEGFPFIVIRNLSGFFFRSRGVSLESVGLTSFFGLPWILKFLWGPYVDEFSTKRRWLLTMEALLALIIIGAAALSPLSGGLQMIAALFVLGSIIAATHDIAVDGFYLAALDPEQQTQFVGYRIMAYRTAMLFGTGVVATVGSRAGWPLAFFLSGGLFAAVFLFHLFCLPEPEIRQKGARQLLGRVFRRGFMLSATGIALLIWLLRQFLGSQAFADLAVRAPWIRQFDFARTVALLLLLSIGIAALLRRRIRNFILRDPDSFYSRSILSFVDQKEIGIILGFIILVRIGEWVLNAMVAPFIVDLGIGAHYGWISGFVGLPCSILGALAGGALIARFGMRRTIWPFLLAQNLTNLVYMALALSLQPYVLMNTGAAQPAAIGTGNLVAVAAVQGFDQIASGLGNVVLIAYVMRLCKAEFKAAHFAIGSGLMSVGSLIAGMSSGFMASWFGYGPFFGLSFLMSLPGMAMIFFIPKDVDARKPAG